MGSFITIRLKLCIPFSSCCYVLVVYKEKVKNGIGGSVVKCLRAYFAVIAQKLCATYGRKEVDVTTNVNPPKAQDLERLFRPMIEKKIGDGDNL